MMKNALSIIFFVMNVFSLMNAETIKQLHIADGIEYVQESIPGSYSFHTLILDPSRVDIKLVTAPKESALSRTTELAKMHGALAALNGGFYKPDGASAGILKVDGVFLSEQKKFPRGAFGWTNDGKKLKIDYVTEDQKQFDFWKDMDNVVNGTPVLLKNKNVTDFSQEKIMQTFIDNRYARTAIGILPNNFIIFVVVDDKGSENTQGMTLHELAEFLKSLGCTDALNLCGGKSSTLCLIDQKNEYKKVNYSFGAWDEVGNHLEKEIFDAILIFKHEVETKESHMQNSVFFNDIEPGVYRNRAIIEFRILETNVSSDLVKKYLKILAEKLSLAPYQEQSEPIVISNQYSQYKVTQGFLFCVQAGLQLMYWEQPQLLSLDIHASIKLDYALIEHITKACFEVVEYASLEILPENIKKDNSKVELRTHHKLGRAIFAQQDIKKGELIGGLYGDIYEAEDSSKLPDGVADHALQFGQHKWRLSHPGGLVQFENHACQANVGVRGLFDLVAIRDIKAGEEIVADYATMEDSDWQFPEGKCLCELPNCRGKFLPFSALSKQEQEKIWNYTSAWIRKKYAVKN